MNPWMIVGFVVALGVATMTGYMKGDSAGRSYVQQQWDKQVAQQQAEYAAAQEAARKKEQAMQVSADQLRQEKDREIRNLNARAAALTSIVQQRPDRPAKSSELSAAPSTGSPLASCTGAELSRPDAEFLAREAARADELRAALRQCVEQYKTVSK